MVSLSIGSDCDYIIVHLGVLYSYLEILLETVMHLEHFNVVLLIGPLVD